jgi:predicted AlkP superfamily phosphohydrolase/phosphomutase
VKLGKWSIPLKSGDVEILRRGRPYWDFLTEHGVNAYIYRIPANYPPQPASGDGEFVTLTDMGTPDLLGEMGKCAFYTTGSFAGSRQFGGGEVYRLVLKPLGGNVAYGDFHGPPDPLLNPEKVSHKRLVEPLKTPFALYRDKPSRSAVVEWEGGRVVLAEGEWSDWQTVEFSMGPSAGGVYAQTISGTVRLFLRKVDPAIEMYMTPIQINPFEPALPISEPPEFAEEVATAIGPYFTQGLPEDTQGLRNKVLTRDEFLQQADLIYHERLRLLDFAMDRFERGHLFFYFGSTDQVGHMFWSAQMESHPALTEEETEKYRNVMRDLYVQVDDVVGMVVERFPRATILCISDHGFADFARGFNLNTWLVENGYCSLQPGLSDRSAAMSIDYATSRAYGMGINGLYINLKGREGKGIVEPAEKKALMNELAEKLLQVRDPKTGAQVIDTVYQCDEVYSGPETAHGPDIQLGYALGYRASWNTILGGAPDGLVEDNTEAWCGDHCIATHLVPGVIFSNRPLGRENPTIEDLAPTVLKAYGIKPPEVMKGGSVFEKGSRVSSSR